MFNNIDNFRKKLQELVEVSEVEKMMTKYRNIYGAYTPKHGLDFYLTIKNELDKINTAVSDE